VNNKEKRKDTKVKKGISVKILEQRKSFIQSAISIFKINIPKKGKDKRQFQFQFQFQNFKFQISISKISSISISISKFQISNLNFKNFILKILSQTYLYQLKPFIRQGKQKPSRHSLNQRDHPEILKHDQIYPFEFTQGHISSSNITTIRSDQEKDSV